VVGENIPKTRQRTKKTNKNDGRRVRGCGDRLVEEGVMQILQVLSNSEKEKRPIERRCICAIRVCVESDTIIDAIWCVVVEWMKPRGSGGGCGVKYTLNVGYPICPQGRVLSSE